MRIGEAKTPYNDEPMEEEDDPVTETKELDEEEIKLAKKLDTQLQ